MTEAEAYEKLGLIDPDHYAKCVVLEQFSAESVEFEGIKFPKLPADRQTGRTTRMLVKAAIALIAGHHIRIRTGSKSITSDLRELCINMAKQLKPDIGEIILNKHDQLRIKNALRGERVFRDHYDWCNYSNPGDNEQDTR